MKDNKKLEEFLNTKVGELGKKYFESFMEDRNKNSTDEKIEKIMEELHELKYYVKDTRKEVERIWNYK